MLWNIQASPRLGPQAMKYKKPETTVQKLKFPKNSETRKKNLKPIQKSPKPVQKNTETFK